MNDNLNYLLKISLLNDFNLNLQFFILEKISSVHKIKILLCLRTMWYGIIYFFLLEKFKFVYIYSSKIAMKMVDANLKRKAMRKYKKFDNDVCKIKRCIIQRLYWFLFYFSFYIVADDTKMFFRNTHIWVCTHEWQRRFLNFKNVGIRNVKGRKWKMYTINVIWIEHKYSNRTEHSR